MGFVIGGAVTPGLKSGIEYSEDGYKWRSARVNISETYNVRDVMYYDGYWVALAVGAWSSFVLRSRNGSSWSKVGDANISFVSARFLPYHNDKYYIYGSFYTASSSDLINWVVVNVNPPSGSVNESVSYASPGYWDGNVYTLAIAEEKTYTSPWFGYSYDRVSWVWSDLDPTTYSGGYAYANGLYVSVDKKSLNGISWTAPGMGYWIGNNQNTMSYGNGRWLLVGGGVAATSTNGSSWSVNSLPINKGSALNAMTVVFDSVTNQFVMPCVNPGEGPTASVRIAVSVDGSSFIFIDSPPKMGQSYYQCFGVGPVSGDSVWRIGSIGMGA